MGESTRWSSHSIAIHVAATKYVGGSALMASHIRAIQEGQNILEPHVLADFTMKDVVDHYRDDMTGQVTVQLLEERLENFRKVGRVLRDESGSHFLNVLNRANSYLYRDDG